LTDSSSRLRSAIARDFLGIGRSRAGECPLRNVVLDRLVGIEDAAALAWLCEGWSSAQFAPTLKGPGRNPQDPSRLGFGIKLHEGRFDVIAARRDENSRYGASLGAVYGRVS